MNTYSCYENGWIIVIVNGILGFAVTGISFTTGEDVQDIGPFEVVRE